MKWPQRNRAGRTEAFVALVLDKEMLRLPFLETSDLDCLCSISGLGTDRAAALIARAEEEAGRHERSVAHVPPSQMASRCVLTRCKMCRCCMYKSWFNPACMHACNWEEWLCLGAQDVS
jgi:hypothetical protein